MESINICNLTEDPMEEETIKIEGKYYYALNIGINRCIQCDLNDYCRRLEANGKKRFPCDRIRHQLVIFKEDKNL